MPEVDWRLTIEKKKKKKKPFLLKQLSWSIPRGTNGHGAQHNDSIKKLIF
jgi:hypothetical protein